MCQNVQAGSKSFYHNCEQRYDCARQEYTDAIPEIVTEPVTNTSVFGSLSVSFQVRIPMAIDSFDADRRDQLLQSISKYFNVPMAIVSIINVIEIEVPGAENQDFVQLSVTIGLLPSSTCISVACNEVHISETITLTTLNEDMPGSVIVQEPVCKLCTQTSKFVFVGAGTLNDPFSCRKECSVGFYQFQGLATASCQPHSQVDCFPGQFLQAGTPNSDAVCVNCTTCDGARLLEPCSLYHDTVCEKCPDPVRNQYWIGDNCSLACDKGFVWNNQQQLCEFCAEDLCSPGFYAPVNRDNCTHCVACPNLPQNAHWSKQNDRFECMWLCNANYHFVNLKCIATNFSIVRALNKLQPLCDPGEVEVNFHCTSCFEAATLGHVSLQSLPQPEHENVKWQWLYGCQWQCMHTAGYWELRSQGNSYWECSNEKKHTVMLRGVDTSWANTVSSGAQNASQTQSLRKTKNFQNLYFYLMLLVSVPACILICMVFVGVARLQWTVKSVEVESEPLLKV
jgi:hypothetical protein